MAGVAAAGAVEIRFALFRVPSDDVKRVIGAAVGGELHFQMQEFGDVAQLAFGQRGKCRHAFIGPPFQ